MSSASLTEFRDQMTAADVVITTLADSEAALREHVRSLEQNVVSLEQDVVAYRELLRRALDAVVQLTREVEMLDQSRYTYQAHTGKWRETTEEREGPQHDEQTTRPRD